MNHPARSGEVKEYRSNYLKEAVVIRSNKQTTRWELTAVRQNKHNSSTKRKHSDKTHSTKTSTKNTDKLKFLQSKTKLKPTRWELTAVQQEQQRVRMTISNWEHQFWYLQRYHESEMCVNNNFQLRTTIENMHVNENLVSKWIGTKRVQLGLKNLQWMSNCRITVANPFRNREVQWMKTNWVREHIELGFEIGF